VTSRFSAREGRSCSTSPDTLLKVLRTFCSPGFLSFRPLRTCRIVRLYDSSGELAAVAHVFFF